MKTEIDNLIDSEKRQLDNRRYQQRRIIRVVAMVLLCIIVTVVIIGLFTIQKELSKQQIYTISLYIVAVCIVSGVIEYIKIKIKGNQRSLVFVLIQLAVLVIFLLLMAQQWKTD